ncbi:MAG: tetratricopeptide repeat protein [Ktedonobacteraceae bacterium]
MTSKKSQQPIVPQGDDAHLQHLLEQRHSIAETLHGSSSRVQAETALASITSNAENTQLALLKALAKQRDMDAADVLLALNELAPDKAVRKEARRALIQLAGSKIYPSWTPEPERPAAQTSSYVPRFWKGVIPIMREMGEIEIILCWEQGFEYGEVRMMNFLLDFWQNGVKDFHSEIGTKRHIESHINELVTSIGGLVGKEVSMTDCTLAEARRLILDALMVNRLRKTTPHKDYRHHLPTIQQLVFDAPNAGEDRGRTFIDPDMEPDEMVTHAVGGWSLGDYGLFYDLLTADNPIREGLPRDEWMERRYEWVDEAHPTRFEVTVIREREHNQSALWLPGSFLSDRSASRREVEVCWSLELTEIPLGGTLLEMPMGTAVLRETGRHWFWSSYTLAQEEGAWRIQRMTDEGANAQGLALSDIQKRLKEHEDAIQQIMQTKKPTDPDGQQSYEEIIWRTVQAMHYLDALLVKLPLDFDMYADATGRATSIGNNERALVYLEQWERRFPQDYRHTAVLQQLGAIESALAAQYDEAGLQERSRRFFDLSETRLQEALEKDQTPVAYVLLGEVKAQLGAYDEAQRLFEAALQANPAREMEAMIENDLATLAQDRQRYEEALRHFLRVVELNTRHERGWFNVARTYRLLKNDVEAEVYYQRAIEEEPQNVDAFSELAIIYVGRHELPKAYAVVEQGARLHPLSAHLRGMLAGILLDMGEPRRAQAMLEEAERIDPEDEMVQTIRQMLESKKK